MSSSCRAATWRSNANAGFESLAASGKCLATTWSRSARSPLKIRAGGEELERTDPDMAGRDAGKHRARQNPVTDHALTGGNHRQAACGRNAQCVHGFADQVFAQHRPESSAAVTRARVWCRARALELDVEAEPGRRDDLPEQQRASVAKLGDEVAELMSGIRHRKGAAVFGRRIAGEQICRLRFDGIGIHPQFAREVTVEDDQRWPGYRRGGKFRKEAGRKASIAVRKLKSHRAILGSELCSRRIG